MFKIGKEVSRAIFAGSARQVSLRLTWIAILSLLVAFYFGGPMAVQELSLPFGILLLLALFVLPGGKGKQKSRSGRRSRKAA
jgi:hypothetical protein